ncbi:OstA family protein [Croceibacterium mercuriale]|uniref:OstA family protein n=2 Tax=Croceibacterium mercuriale TaxID=1572751 RepID=A0A0B2BU06_9SPHN|nr:OstA family protein [Croceibacterium mercuriale]
MSLPRLAARSFAVAFGASALVALGFSGGADAQAFAGFNANQPVNYAADRIELQDRQNRVVLSGNVVIDQGDLRLTAGRTTVAFTDTGTLQIQRIDATGGVTVNRGAEQAQGAVGVYDFNRKLIILSGGVGLRRGGDTLNGGRLTIDLNTGISSVDGRGSAPGAAGSSASSGRVTGTFSVPD